MRAFYSYLGKTYSKGETEKVQPERTRVKLERSSWQLDQLGVIGPDSHFS